MWIAAFSSGSVGFFDMDSAWVESSVMDSE